MEPHIVKEEWGEWTNPDISKFFRVCDHSSLLNYNNVE